MLLGRGQLTGLGENGATGVTSWPRRRSRTGYAAAVRLFVAEECNHARLPARRRWPATGDQLTADVAGAAAGFRAATAGVLAATGRR